MAPVAELALKEEEDGGKSKSGGALVAKDEAAPAPGKPEREGNIEDAVPFSKLLSGAETIDYVYMAIGVVGACGNGVTWPVFAVVFSSFTDTFGGTSSSFMSDVSLIALNFVYIAIGAAVGSYLQASMWMWVGTRLTSRLRMQYLNAVLRQDISFFDTQTTTGSLLQGLNEDSGAVQAAVSEKVAHFIQHSTTAIVGIIVAFTGGWDMTLVMIGVLPLLALVGIVMSKVTVVMSGRSTEAYTKASSLAQQALSQLRTVMAYCGEERAVQYYTESLEMPTNSGIRQGFYTGLSLGGANFIIYCSYAIAFYYGAWRVSTGDYTGGQVLQVFVAALLGGFSVGQAAPVLEVFAKGRSAGARLYRVIDREPSINSEDESGLTPEKVVGAVELQNVSFHYPARPDVQVFRNFSLMVPAGKTVALVGSSGSGKSTVVQLIERFYDPHSGVVMLDGIDLRDLQVKWLRSKIGLVSQEPTLFATTILENIQMGCEGATMEEVEAAARSANAHTFISHLPEGYNTQVGERGLQLSGGQKQRVAIARAILKNPRVMLLDEATSALDTHSERIVQDALNRLIVGRTTIVVAHRLSTIKDADMIAVVRKGEVVELGSHDELTKDPIGAYTNLVRLQMQEEGKKEEEAGSSSDLSGVEEEEMEAEIVEDAAIMAEKGQDPLGKTSHPLPPGARVSGTFAGEKRTSHERTHGSGMHRISMEKPGAKAVVTVEADAEEGEEKGEKKKEEEYQVPFSRLLYLNRPEWKYGVLGIIASAGAGAVQPAFAFVIASFVVVFYNTDTGKIMEEASFYSWMYFTIACGCIICTTLQMWSFGVMGCELARRVRIQLLRSMLHQEVGWHDQEANSSGILTTRLASDASYVRGAVGDTAGLMLQNVLCLAFGYVIAFAYDWRMALVVTGALPFMISGSVIYYQNVTGRESASTGLYSKANQAVSDAFSSIRVVQAYNLQEKVASLYDRLVYGVTQSMFKSCQVNGLLMGYSQFTIFATYGLIIYFGGVEVDSGRVDFDGMLKAFLAILLAAMGIAQAQIGFPDIGKAKDAIKSIFPIIDRQSLIDASLDEGIKAPPRGGADLEGTIELRDVHFVYPARPSVTIFKSFSLVIPAGQTVAMVGESGSGKSTVVGLTLRYYDALGGQVLIDGVDVKSYNLKWLRSHIGLVSQEPLLFSMTVLDNIRYGRPEASMEEIEAAARAANAHDFIAALPEGYMTQVGEKGVQLSGGQKQRVAIARAVVKKPRIMLLDEATSALDAESEKVVQEALDNIMVGRTSVVVAHRLSTIRNADKIALVQKGVILEQGNHAELMNLPDGGYARLVAAQMGRSNTIVSNGTISRVPSSASTSGLAKKDSTVAP